MTIEVMKLALDALENSAGDVEYVWRKAEETAKQWPARMVRVIGLKKLHIDHQESITTLRQAISQPDCRGCDSFVYGDDLYKDGCNAASVCTNGDKFQALPKVMLYKVTPQA